MNKCLLEDSSPQVSAAKYNLSTVYLYFKYCNLKCRHCWINPPYTEQPGLKEDEVSLKELISALEECRALGMRAIKVTGGEPLTRKDIFEFLDYIRENKIRLTLETNATLIGKRESQALKDAGAKQVAVSLDGPTAQVHESLRGAAGSFNAALEGIKYLKKAGLNIQVIISLWQDNKEQLKSTIVLAQTLGANSVKINPILNISRAARMSQDKETLSVKETIEFYYQLRQELKKEPGMKVIFDIPPAFQPLVNQRFKDLCTCGIFNILGILGDGRISICGIGTSRETLILGKIGENNIRNIWDRHPVLREIREGVPKKMSGICGRCILKHYCIGKCRAEAYYDSGSLLGPLSFCQTAYEQGLFPASRMIS